MAFWSKWFSVPQQVADAAASVVQLQDTLKLVISTKTVYWSELTIDWTDGSSSGWTWTLKGKEEVPIEYRLYPWKDFIRWYFGRTSEAYLFVVKEGGSLILRSRIKSFMYETKSKQEARTVYDPITGQKATPETGGAKGGTRE